MPSYYDSKSSNPKKTKKTRYPQGMNIEGRPKPTLTPEQEAYVKENSALARQRQRGRKAAKRTSTQARRQATRKKRRYSKGGTVKTDAYGKYTIARGSGAARPQKFRKDG